MAYKHKRSSISGKIPNAADFTDGQILVNTADGRAFILTPAGVVGIGSKEKAADSEKLNGKTEAQMAASGAIANALGGKLDKTATAADSAKFGNQTVAQWDAKINAKVSWPGVYTGTDAFYSNYPIGTTVLAYGSIDANSSVVIAYRSTTGSYEVNGSGTVLSGQWRSRGRGTGTPGFTLAERVL